MTAQGTELPAIYLGTVRSDMHIQLPLSGSLLGGVPPSLSMATQAWSDESAMCTNCQRPTMRLKPSALDFVRKYFIPTGRTKNWTCLH